jgi:hypothetical protein
MNEKPNNDSEEGGVWDATIADQLVGSTCLIGMTVLDGEKVVETTQMYGVVTAVDERNGITFALAGSQAGNTWMCPPDTRAFRKAALGSYRQRHDGVIVENPDWIATWTKYLKSEDRNMP